ncbi:Glycosyltransferase involved in cell wall bisynthesis [Mariniphaga anaerophila]|uniref:Glycosyltransferase involved in cell wall bisynthesis n=1 Tax=Mariniphaga anaerophila TaxID=1484053 RepID=A0A1M5AIZ1_9BACT|nr:glycosyltransferase [Mariniphaga anaerophila]SHF30241.1 Glycosyltransferase involved in cell wall bisynthesis [Mariniphaga anaerophila]
MNSEVKKRIIASVTSDLVSDNRVHKTCLTLTNMGFEVLLVGRKLPTSLPLSERLYSVKRLNLLFTKGPLFYACFNIRLFCLLLFSKFDLLLANDLDTLPANFFISKLKRKPMVYDSHEFFTEVPELQERPRVRKIWERMEQKMVPSLKNAYTVCNSIASIYTEKYGVRFRVVRNVPFSQPVPTGKKADSETGEKTILYQGAVNVGRGLKQAILAMHFVDSAKLVIAGDGDIRNELEELTREEGLQSKVQFLGRLPIADLAKLTSTADLGISIEEDIGLNYRFALPNKLFDYIQAKVPVLVTNLPEMAAIVNQYKIGEVAPTLESPKLAKLFSEMLTDQSKRAVWKKNLETASSELTWENEAEVLKGIFQPFA